MRSDPIHDSRNPKSHFFYDGRDARSIPSEPPAPRSADMVERVTVPAVAKSIPVKREKRTPDPVVDHRRDERRCVQCGKPRVNHRGRGHKFVEPAAEVSSPVFASPTVAQLIASFTDAIAQAHAAPHKHLRNVSVRPQYAPGTDSELLTATVHLEVLCTFTRQP
jgi:hypothetical protein